MCRLLALPPFQISGADSPNQRGRESACTRVPAARGNGLTTSMPAVPMATSLVVSAKPRLVSLTASASAVAVFRFSSGRVSRRQERSRISSSQYPSRIPDAYASTTHTLKTRKHAQNRTITTQTSGREVERHLTGKATEVSEVIYFSGLRGASCVNLEGVPLTAMRDAAVCGPLRCSTPPRIAASLS
jgi:hypothetical protein